MCLASLHLWPAHGTKLITLAQRRCRAISRSEERTVQCRARARYKILFPVWIRFHPQWASYVLNILPCLNAGEIVPLLEVLVLLLEENFCSTFLLSDSFNRRKRTQFPCHVWSIHLPKLKLHGLFFICRIFSNSEDSKNVLSTLTHGNDVIPSRRSCYAGNEIVSTSAINKIIFLPRLLFLPRESEFRLHYP